MRRQTVEAAAYRMRHHALNMGEAQGQGYVGQALGAADMLACVYADQLRYRADDPHWAERDRFLLSTGHYAIGLYAALAEAGIIDVAELDTYGSPTTRGCRCPEWRATHRGWRSPAARSGTGCTVAVGMALGLRHQGSAVAGDQLPLRRRTRRGLDVGGGDGCQPSSPRQPDRDGGHQRAAGRRSDRRCAAHRTGAATSGSPADGSHSASTATTSRRCSRPSTRSPNAPTRSVSSAVIVCDTKVGRGVPLLENSEKAHFMRIDADEWQICREQLTAGYEGVLV